MATKDLVKTVNDITIRADKLIDKSSSFMQIATRGADPNNKEILKFRSLTDDKIQKIADKMPEINRATQSFGKKNTQTTSKLMSIHMLAQGPFRRIRQCMAQIESKRSAIKKIIFKFQRERVEIDRLLYKIESIEDGNINQDTKFDVEIMQIDIQEKITDMVDSLIYLEGSLKEIGMYQEAYEEIKSSNNISDDWDELTMEQAEVEENIKAAFINAVRDVFMSGRINVGTHEYLEQFGINPVSAYNQVMSYINSISQNDDISIDSLYDFLDEMGKKYKDEWKKSMKRLGLKNLISKDFLYRESL